MSRIKEHRIRKYFVSLPEAQNYPSHAISVPTIKLTQPPSSAENNKLFPFQIKFTPSCVSLLPLYSTEADGKMEGGGQP